MKNYRLNRKIPKKGMLKDPKKEFKRQKVRNGLKLAAAIAALGLLGYFISNDIRANLYNDTPPVKDPFTSGNIFDPNGNDFDFGEDGQIEIDTMTEAEKNVLTQNLGKLIINDAYACDSEIGNIKNIVSISLLPYNLDDSNNEYDKYYLSIIFNDDHSTYSLNYITGTDFVSTGELSKDCIVDFINFLNFECALDSCTKMSDDALKLKSLFGDGVVYVGEAYQGQRESGELYYFIPVFRTNGMGEAYCAWASPIDSYDANPMELLYNELTANDEQEKSFESIPFTVSAGLQNIYSIINNQLSFSDQNIKRTPAPPTQNNNATETPKTDENEDELE